MDHLHREPLGGGLFIYVTDSYHFTTDTILLADFSLQRGAKRCADLGTGCGTIPLLWLRENPLLQIDAVELQEDACALARRSAEENGLSDRVNILSADLRDLKGRLPLLGARPR